MGDAVEKKNTVLDIDMPFYMAGPANRQGRVVADVIAGMDHKCVLLIMFLNHSNTYLISIRHYSKENSS